MAKFLKPIKWVATSLWLRFLLLLVGVLIYNQLCYTQQWVTARPVPYFGDTVAPLYANVKFWIEDAISQAHPDDDFQVPQGITDFVHQLDRPSRIAIEKVLARRTQLLLTPLIVFLLIGGGVIGQLAIRRQMAPWAIALMLPALALCVNVSVAEMDGGPMALFGPFNRTDLEYFGDVPRVNDAPIKFVHDYASLVGIRNPVFKLTHHSRTHPPGPILFLWWVGKHFDPSIQTASWAAILITSLSAIPAYLLARHRFGNTAALVAAGIYLLTPSLVLFGATSMDGVMALPMITTLWLLTVSLMVPRYSGERGQLCSFGKSPQLAGESSNPSPLPSPRSTGEREKNILTDDPLCPEHFIRPGWRSVICAILAGVTLTVAAFMSYATLCIGIVMAIFLLAQLLVSWRWFLRSVILMAIVTLVFLGCTWWLMAATGYDPIACVHASMLADDSVVGGVRRHWIDVSFANGIAFLIGIGLITTTLWLSAVGTSIRQLIRRSAEHHVFELAMFVAIGVISFSKLFTLETERIWIFLMPLLIAPAANQLVRISRLRFVLVIQASLVFLLLIGQTWLCQLLLNTWW